MTGIVAATFTFFVANRLLPSGASFAGIERAALEVWAFYLVWLASFAHAWLRPRSAWREQCLAIAALALAAPLLNWITTGHHPLVTLPQPGWGSAVFGMDALLLLAGALAWYASRRLNKVEGASSSQTENKRKQDAPATM